MEPLAYDGLVGETFNCLISKVFHNLKYGDRFFYEMKNQRGSLSDGMYLYLCLTVLSQTKEEVCLMVCTFTSV